MRDMENIDGLVELFQNFGGKFENAALGYRDESGFYCYTLDSNQDTVISCPANLLVDILDVGVRNDGLFILNPEKYGSNMNFLEKYFAFHFNRAILNQHIEQKRQIDSLSSRDLSLISNVLPPDLYNLEDYGELEYAKKRVLDSHKIKHYGKSVLMPFVSFLNHDKNGLSFNTSKDEISISGRCDNEVFVEYNIGDVFLIGGAYGFITDTKVAYSLPVYFEMPNGTRVNIGRDLEKSSSNDKGRVRPIVEKKRGTVTISWFPLYLEGAPRYPAILARRIAAETNLSAEILLMDIFRLNLHVLIPAAFHLKNSENSFAKYVAIIAQRQLETIAGTREQ